ncbi:MAG: hypothetical protein P4L66_05025 [Acetobacteraceae bacterium]|nr:hypothetical protein [Acetobacteraceae bacterium]
MTQVQIKLPLFQSYRPRSFRERGVAPPFTTRLLLGARLRQPPESPTGAGLEVIVPNPSGGRGVYILPWDTVGVLGRPSLHDVVLGRTLTTLVAQGDGRLSPQKLARAVTDVALQGFAGPLAAQAAADTTQAARSALLATRFRLLTSVTERIEGPENHRTPLVADTPENIEQRGFAALTVLAGRLQQPAQHLFDALDRMAGLFAEIGEGAQPAAARLPRLVVTMQQLCQDLIAWAQTESGHDGTCPAAELRNAVHAARAAELVVRIANSLLTQARALLADPVAALRSIVETEAEVMARLDRVFWLLDGWENIVRIWLASPLLFPRSAAVQDIAQSLPLLPDEAESWLGLPTGTVGQLDRTVSTSIFRARGLPVEQMALQERLRMVAV